MLRLALAGLHLLGLGVGLGAIWARSSALRGTLDGPGIRRVLTADAWWGVAALLWLSTGLWRMLGGIEKPLAYYLANHLFLTKLALFIAIVAMEIRPMLLFGRWRRSLAAGQAPDTALAMRAATTGRVQAVLVVVMVFLAVAMARGYGGR